MANGIVNKFGVALLSVGMFLAIAPHSYAIPAFARKYGLPCSACHEAWPKLNSFGIAFRDNGYQLGKDRDAPINQDPGYWPIAFRMTPQWHRESTSPQPIDAIAGDGSSGFTAGRITKSGVDTSAIDMLVAGTLYRNVSFFTQPFLSNSGVFLAQMFVRFDNLAGSRWVNVKLGKFELDLPISEERTLTLDNTGGGYFNYHFHAPGDSNVFGGIGDAQLGVELSGHSDNSYTRYSITLASSGDGRTGLAVNSTYNVFGNFTQGFELPKLGLQRVGAYAYLGQSPTYFQTAGGSPIAGTGTGNRSFYRAGAYGLWYAGKFDLSTFFEHGQDNVYLGNSIPANQPSLLPPGAVGPSWNGGFAELHYTYNPQLVLISRYEILRMARQANPDIAKELGNLDAWTVGYRWYPFMSSRAGLAWVQEYSHLLTQEAAPVFGTNEHKSSYLMGFDFDF
jgi:hypothetical protein